jgi:hypothetical protein
LNRANNIKYFFSISKSTILAIILLTSNCDFFTDGEIKLKHIGFKTGLVDFRFYDHDDNQPLYLDNKLFALDNAGENIILCDGYGDSGVTGENVAKISKYPILNNSIDISSGNSLINNDYEPNIVDCDGLLVFADDSMAIIGIDTDHTSLFINYFDSDGIRDDAAAVTILEADLTNLSTDSAASGGMFWKINDVKYWEESDKIVITGWASNITSVMLTMILNKDGTDPVCFYTDINAQGFKIAFGVTGSNSVFIVGQEKTTDDSGNKIITYGKIWSFDSSGNYNTKFNGGSYTFSMPDSSYSGDISHFYATFNDLVFDEEIDSLIVLGTRNYGGRTVQPQYSYGQTFEEATYNMFVVSFFSDGAVNKDFGPDKTGIKDYFRHLKEDSIYGTGISIRQTNKGKRYFITGKKDTLFSEVLYTPSVEIWQLLPDGTSDGDLVYGSIELPKSNTRSVQFSGHVFSANAKYSHSSVADAIETIIHGDYIYISGDFRYSDMDNTSTRTVLRLY